MKNTAIGIVACSEFSMDPRNLQNLNEYHPYRKSILNPIRKCNAINNISQFQKCAEVCENLSCQKYSKSLISNQHILVVGN